MLPKQYIAKGVIQRKAGIQTFSSPLFSHGQQQEDLAAVKQKRYGEIGYSTNSSTQTDFIRWVETWKDSKPQRSIYEQNLPRDRWRWIEIPTTLAELQDALKRPDVQQILGDAQQRNYWLYATGRTFFFFASSLANALLQIRLQPDWRPWVAGRTLRTEVAAALKRVAMSGERAGVADTATRIPNTAERVRKLFGSILELYRRDCQHIVCGLYRAPYDASLRHRQFSPLFVRGAFLRTLEARLETGVRRRLGRRGFLEVRAAVHRRAAAAQSGVALLPGEGADGSDADDGVYNDNYLLGDVGRYPPYYLQNFHWQTDGWLSTRSARAYEYSTETLFSGCQARSHARLRDRDASSDRCRRRPFRASTWTKRALGVGGDRSRSQARDALALDRAEPQNLSKSTAERRRANAPAERQGSNWRPAAPSSMSLPTWLWHARRRR